MKIQSLNLDPNKLMEAEGSFTFWRRQFQQDPTPKQKSFDWAYGVGIPLVCVAADPIVFTEYGVLETYRPFAHTLSAASILAMAAWLLWGEKLKWLAAPLAGLFIAGSFVSLIVGLRLLPLSLVGLFFVIGFLGLTPLFSAIVYLRNGVRAFRSAKLFVEPRVVVQAGLLAALFGLVIPYVINARF